MLKDIKMDDLQKLKRSVLWKEHLKPLFKYRAEERKEFNIVYGSKEVMIKQIEMYRDLPKLTSRAKYDEVRKKAIDMNLVTYQQEGGKKEAAK